MVKFENLRTVKQIAQSNPAFSEASLRWLIFNAESNGLSEAIVHVGWRVFLDEPVFNRCLERGRKSREGVNGIPK